MVKRWAVLSKFEYIPFAVSDTNEIVTLSQGKSIDKLALEF